MDHEIVDQISEGYSRTMVSVNGNDRVALCRPHGTTSDVNAA